MAVAQSGSHGNAKEASRCLFAPTSCSNETARLHPFIQPAPGILGIFNRCDAPSADQLSRNAISMAVAQSGSHGNAKEASHLTTIQAARPFRLRWQSNLRIC